MEKETEGYCQAGKLALASLVYNAQPAFVQTIDRVN
jgi:hypothetical protein